MKLLKLFSVSYSFVMFFFSFQFIISLSLISLPNNVYSKIKSISLFTNNLGSYNFYCNNIHATNFFHSLALKFDGTVWAWGKNNYGQLGNNTKTSSNFPVQVKNLDDIISITGGSVHSIALKKDGTVWGWGYNAYGQLGTGEFGSNIDGEKIPVQAYMISNVINISSGSNHNLALRNDGTVWAWGENNKGQLGNNSTSDNAIPSQIEGLKKIKLISAGPDYSLAVTIDGNIWGWGNNRNFQLGDGTDGDKRIPGKCSTIPGIVSISSGCYHSLALKNDGTVWAWGINNDGVLGIGTNSGKESSPVQVKNISNIIAISAGYYHSLALKSDGTVWAWGQGSQGEIGNGYNIADCTLPAQVKNITEIVSISAGKYYSLALKKDGTVWAWGENYLGNGSNNSNLPVQVMSDSSSTFLLGIKPTAKLNSTHILYNGNNVIFDGSSSYDSNGTIESYQWKIISISNSKKLLLEGREALAILEEGFYEVTLKVTDDEGATDEDQMLIAVTGQCCDCLFDIHQDNRLDIEEAINALKGIANISNNVYSKMKSINLKGIANMTNNVYSKVKLINLSNNNQGSYYYSIYAATNVHSLALKFDGTVWAWGGNSRGQLGNNTKTPSNFPIQVNNLDNIISITGGANYSIALKNDGTVWGWGYNAHGELGIGEYGSNIGGETIPVQTYMISNVISISSGDNHTLALKNDGTVWAWGENREGQLGNNSTSNNAIPTQIEGLQNIKLVSAGKDFSLAVSNDGIIWGWGENSSYQLGDGTRYDKNSPVECSTIPDIVSISSGYYRTLVLKNDGTVWTWGSGDRIPFQVISLTNIVAISAGYNHSLALKNDGTAWAWGNGYHGQIGNGYYEQSISPVQVKNITEIVSISAGRYYSLALKKDGTIWAWGENFLGNGSTTSNIPVQVMSDSSSIFLLGKRPTAKLQATHLIYKGNNVILDGSSSYDSNGQIENYQWKIISTSNNTQLLLEGRESQAILEKGFYEVTLKVTDNEGVTDEDQMLIAVAGQCCDCSFDIHQDGRLGIEEAINALKEVANMSEDNHKKFQKKQ